MWFLLGATLRSRLSLHMEILALRHQLAICQRTGKRPHTRPADRILWAWLSRIWFSWRDALIFVSTALWSSALGLPQAEVYNSASDDGVGGLPKLGSALPASVSSVASDHYLVIADIQMADAVPLSTSLTIVGVDAAGAHLSFDSASNQLYTLQFADDINGASAWSNVTDFVDLSGTGGDLTYFDADAGTGSTSTEDAQRMYRLMIALP